MRDSHAKVADTLFAPVGAPRKGSHEEVIRLRLKGDSARVAGEKTGYKSRHVQEITALFRHQVLPRIKELHREKFTPGVIAGEVGQPEDIVILAIERFAEAS